MVLPVTVLKRRQAADDARLLAVCNGVVAYDVMADGLLVPAVLEGASMVLT